MTDGRRPLILMNPGPVNVAEEVRAALLAPDMCHREPDFAGLMTEVRAKLTKVCGGDERHTSVVLTGSGTAAIEAAIASVLPDEGGLLVLDNGHYGRRLFEIAEVYGIRTHCLKLGWGEPITAEAVDRALTAEPAVTHVAVVHHETSTGMRNDVAAIATVARRHGVKIIVDAVSSVGAEEISVADSVDWLIGSANKCLEGMPGLSFVCGERQAFEDLRTGPHRVYYLDLWRHYHAQEKSLAPAFTPAVQVFAAFGAALDRMLTEGVTGRGARYRGLAEKLRAGLAELGLSILLPPEHRAVGLTAVRLPANLRYQDLHQRLRAAGFVIYAAQEQLAADYFRLSTMGVMTEADIDAFLGALERILSEADR